MIQYVLKKNVNEKMPNAYGKFFAYPVITQTYDIDQLVDHMASHNVSIRSTPYCKSQNNVVPLHGGIIFPNFETRIRSLALHQHKLMEVIP